MGIFQFLIFIFFILVYVGIVGMLIARLMGRNAAHLFHKGGERKSELPLRG
ncbi:MAG TPA: hypothetical protein VNN73_21900 [Blastocatellia bacterium]|nr:hypothetical protein [Blastocatellia bacterium]